MELIYTQQLCYYKCHACCHVHLYMEFVVTGLCRFDVTEAYVTRPHSEVWIILGHFLVCYELTHDNVVTLGCFILFGRYYRETCYNIKDAHHR